MGKLGDRLGRDTACEIAREVVKDDSVRPSYCADPATFEPHPWVIAAIIAAYRRGFLDGVDHVLLEE